jgi:hypothetical protein
VNQTFTGRAKYQTDVAEAGATLELAVTCRVGDLDTAYRALLDTACPWCLLPPSVAAALGFDLETVGDIRLHTRFGLLVGDIVRLPVTFVVDEGEALDVESTCFLSPDWPGPVVIGWKGCLQRMRFAFDPGENDFYVAEL